MHILVAQYLGYKGPEEKKRDNEKAMEELIAQFGADGGVIRGG